MDDIFKLKGRMTNHAGEGISNLLLAIVDQDDMDEADLIGLGKTLEDGSFQVTFLGSEFRQDMLEMEMTPDIMVVASAEFDGVNKALFQRAFPALDWSGGEVDLGNIAFENYDPDVLTPLEGVDPIPGFSKSVQRLEIDNAMVRHCMAEVAPIVEKLTGWSNLLDGLNVAVQDGTNSFTMRNLFEAQGIEPDSMQAQITTWIADHALAPGMGCALYDPGTHTVVINTSVMENVGLDVLKVMIGHELVHVGQFKYTPGLKGYQEANMREMPTNPTPDQLEELKAKAAYNTELEGYAAYIEFDYLRKLYYPMANVAFHASFLDKFAYAAVSLLVPNTGEEATESKRSQYIDGHALYREREKTPGLPTRFQFDLSKYPGSERFM